MFYVGKNNDKPARTLRTARIKESHEMNFCNDV